MEILNNPIIIIIIILISIIAFPYASPIKNMDMMHVAVTIQIDANGLNLITHLDLRESIIPILESIRGVKDGNQNPFKHNNIKTNEEPNKIHQNQVSPHIIKNSNSIPSNNKNDNEQHKTTNNKK